MSSCTVGDAKIPWHSMGARPWGCTLHVFPPCTDLPRLQLSSLVCSSHLAFQPNIWSCPSVSFRSIDHPALGQPHFCSLQVTAPTGSSSDTRVYFWHQPSLPALLWDNAGLENRMVRSDCPLGQERSPLLDGNNFANGHKSRWGRELSKIACKAADLHSQIILGVMFPVLGLEHASPYWMSPFIRILGMGVERCMPLFLYSWKVILP